jgi:hypothetical protein
MLIGRRAKVRCFFVFFCFCFVECLVFIALLIEWSSDSAASASTFLTASAPHKSVDGEGTRLYYIRTVNGALDFAATDFLGARDPDFFADYSLSRFWKPGNLNTPDDPAYSYPAISFTAKDIASKSNIAFFCALKPIAGAKSGKRPSANIRIQEDRSMACDIAKAHPCNSSWVDIPHINCTMNDCESLDDTLRYCCYLFSEGVSAVDCINNIGCQSNVSGSSCGRCTSKFINCEDPLQDQFTFTCF